MPLAQHRAEVCQADMPATAPGERQPSATTKAVRLAAGRLEKKEGRRRHAEYVQAVWQEKKVFEALKPGERGGLC